MAPASLPRASDFKRVFAARQCRSNSAMAVYWAPPPEGAGGQRLGLVVGKGVGGAVVRNRLRRVLRAAFTQLAADLPPGDFVVVARPRLCEVDATGGMPAVAAQLRALTKQLRIAP